MKITSLDNPKVSYWSKLQMKKYRDEENTFIVEGENLVEEALKKGIVKEIITSKSFNANVLVYEVTDEIYKKLSMLVNPSYVMAVCSYILPSEINGNVLILDRLQDPGNLGTIIRSAVAFGFNTIIMSKESVDMYNEKVIRASEGMIFNINIIKDDLEKVIPLLKEKGYKIFTTNVNNGSDIKDVKFDKCAFVIGNEGRGVSDAVSSLCDESIYLNMDKKCESLNASVAASIIMYEVYNAR